MSLSSDSLNEFDFFMDEDVRSRRIGILCMEKTLTPALTQALFRIKEKANEFHKLRVNRLKITEKEKKSEIVFSHKQIREIKWSSLNLMRSFIAVEFVQTYFHYSRKGPLPITFINSPFMGDHKQSISYFFKKLSNLKINLLKSINNSQSVFFLDTFTTPGKYRFEEKVRHENNLARCFRIDSRSHDIMQLTDLLLGLSVFTRNNQKISIKNQAKLRVIREFDKSIKNNKKAAFSCDPIYYID